MKPSIHKDETFDVIVVGCGPGGTSVATTLAKAGKKVLAIEKQEFPRYHVGESLTGAGGDILRELGLEDALNELDFPVKTGVKVVGREAKSEFYVPVLSPTWQVRRDAFDNLLLEKAKEAGVEVRQGTVQRVLQDGDAVVGVGYRPADDDGSAEDEGDQKGSDLINVRAPMVVDASGHSALMSKHGLAGPRRVETFGRQMAVFAQFEHVERDPGQMGDNTFIFYGEQLHWAWFIPVSSTLTSIGVVVPVRTYKKYAKNSTELLNWGLANINPDLTRRMTQAKQAEETRTISNYSYKIEPYAGDGWVCVGESHRFTDPIFSLGVAFAMIEGREAARGILETQDNGGDWQEIAADYTAFCDRGHDAGSDVIRYFWRFPGFFSYQTRGPKRHDIVRLLAGDCFGEEPLPALADMRNSLHATPLTGITGDRARAIAQKVYIRYADFQGIVAAYIDASDDGVRLSFVEEEDAEDLYYHLHDFEEALYEEFGRDALAVMRWVNSSDFREDIPGFEGAQMIFDRRPPAQGVGSKKGAKKKESA